MSWCGASVINYCYSKLPSLARLYRHRWQILSKLAQTPTQFLHGLHPETWSTCYESLTWHFGVYWLFLKGLDSWRRSTVGHRLWPSYGRLMFWWARQADRVRLWHIESWQTMTPIDNTCHLLAEQRASGFEPATTSLGSRLSVYKPCQHNMLQACFFGKNEVYKWITSHYHVATDQLSDQLSDQLRLRIIACYPPWPSQKGQTYITIELRLCLSLSITSRTEFSETMAVESLVDLVRMAQKARRSLWLDWINFHGSSLWHCEQKSLPQR